LGGDREAGFPRADGLSSPGPSHPRDRSGSGGPSS
jgi:hypothetical protein